jgi:OmcA/MtrC family decaheme c-type cytochrome
VTPGQPLTGTSAEYTVKLTTAKFPAGATMRAVALTGYFTQIVGTDNVGRHTPSVVKGVTGDAVRRTVVKSGYVDNILKPVPVPVTDPALFSTAQPWGCLECHEIFEGHGGSRVNNVQVCVICHNPNLSSSGRTANPDLPIPAETVAAHGSDPLKYPEATNNMKSLIHGIHAAPIRENPFHFVRNRSNGLHYNWSEVTYPGNLRNCQKCHDGVTYDPDLPADQLLSTEKITTGITGETRADIIGARFSIGTATGPDAKGNLTDLVTSPITAACYYCHDDSAAASHFVLNGADILSTRSNALLEPTPAP